MNQKWSSLTEAAFIWIIKPGETCAHCGSGERLPFHLPRHKRNCKTLRNRLHEYHTRKRAN